MLRQIEQLKQDEVKQAVEKKERVNKLMSEVEEANKKAVDVKENKKLEEKHLELKIVEYNRQKALREEEQLAE
jgi:Trichohyalin-plectin-homology domain